MQVLVLGAGGVGGYLGVRMIEAGLSVRFLVRPKRAERLCSQGLALMSPLGSWQGEVDVVVADRVESIADIIILSCKAYDLEDALDAVAPAVGPATVIIPFLNGIRHLDTAIERYSSARIWGGVAHIGVTTEAPNRIIHLNDINRFLIGPLSDAGVSERMHALVDCLCSGVAKVELRSEIRQDMWDKLVFLATLAGMTCTMRSDVGTIMSTRYGGILIEQLLDECGKIALAEGYPPNAEALAIYHAQLTDKRSKSTASMLRDMQAGRATEGQHVLGDLIERASKYDLDVPVLRLCGTHLETYESQRGTSENVT